jgi:DNA-binding SARP family transcriptional activator
MGIDIRVLGRFSVSRDGEEIPPGAFGGRRARTLVRILLSRRGQFISRDFLVEALWPKSPPADPVMNINVLVRRARSALKDPALILTGPGGYSFAKSDTCVVDAEAFLDGVKRGRDLLGETQHSRAWDAFRGALDRWGGEPLAEDAYEDWAQEYRASLLGARLEALEGGAVAALASGDPRQAASLAEQAVLQEPLREASHLLLIEALAASGDTAAALSAFDRLRHLLADELGLDPSHEASKLQARILHGEVLLTPAPRPGQGPFKPALEELPFVGRETELKEALESVSSSFPPPIVVSGPSGAGKSRFLVEIGRRCPRPVLAAQAFYAQREEPWGLARTLLRECLALDVGVAQVLSSRLAQALVDLVPELQELRSIGDSRIDPESRRALALEGAVRLLEGVSPMRPLIVADDVQWADATSLNLLLLAAARVPRIGLVVAYRPEEIHEDAPAASFLAGLQRLGSDLQAIPLGPLSSSAISELIADEDLVRTISVEMEAMPFALAELLRALARRGAIAPDARGRWQAQAPDVSRLAYQLAQAGQRRTIQARVERHGMKERQTLALLALLGREAPARLIAIAQEEEQSATLKTLDALAEVQLVRLGDRGWASQHQHISDVVVEALDRFERGRLHEMIARALQSQGGDFSEIAHHLVGAGDPEAAADAFAEAARRSLDRFANDEAERLSDAGLRLDPSSGTRSRLLEIRAEAKARKGHLHSARDDLREALGHKQTGPDKSRILTRIAILTSGYEDYVRASELIELALTEAGQDLGARAEALTAGARVDMNLNRLDRAEKRAAEALALLERTGDANAMADALDTKVNIELHAGRVPSALHMLDHLARMFQDAGRLLRVGSPRSNRGYLLMFMGKLDEALSDIEEALELERTLGHPAGEAYCLWHRSEVLAYAGRVQEARESAQDALAIARRLGHREWTAAALKGLGVACLAAGALDEAERAYRDCREAASGMPIFSSWAACGLARVLIIRGDYAAAEDYLTRALSEGTAVVRYEVQILRAELAVARGDADAGILVADALRLVESIGGQLFSGRLRQLAAEASPTC